MNTQMSVHTHVPGSTPSLAYAAEFSDNVTEAKLLSEALRTITL